MQVKWLLKFQITFVKKVKILIQRNIYLCKNWTTFYSDTFYYSDTILIYYYILFIYW